MSLASKFVCLVALLRVPAHVRAEQCKTVSYSFCCELGTPCDCKKGTTAAGQCKPESYAFCCSVGTPCDCTQPPEHSAAEPARSNMSLPAATGGNRLSNGPGEAFQNCAAPGDCGLAYEACCAGFAAKGFPCDCQLKEGQGEAGSSCGDCGAAYSACCAGFKAQGFPCTCDVEPATVVV